MPTDSTQTPDHDTPTAAHQHAWKRAARDDHRLTPRHLAVIDSYAEHYYSPKAAMRGVGVSVERLAYWTHYSSSSVRSARAALIRWGWLTRMRGHNPGHVARYALTIPEAFSTASPDSSTGSAQKARIQPFEGAPESAQKARIQPFEASKKPESGLIPLLRSTYLPTSGSPPHDDGPTEPANRPRRGRQGSPTNTTAKPAHGPQADANTVALVLPRALLQTARGARSVPVLGRALAEATAAGWTVEQIREELADIDQGSRQPVGVAVKRLRDLASRPAPVPVVAGPGTDRLDSDALDAGRICEHGNPDRMTTAGVHRCPICRRQKTATTAGEVVGA